MNNTIKKIIILTTRTTGDDFRNYAINIPVDNITINQRNYEYRKINIQNISDKIIILLNGSQLDTSPISISNLQKFDGQINRSNQVSAFLNLINDLAKKEDFKADENLIFAIHWGGVSPLESRNYTENFKKWIEKYCREVKFIITFWTTALSDPAPDRKIAEKLREQVPSINDDEFERWFNILKARALPITINFSLLKHRIAHLFLPLDIDLKGIGEVKGKKVKVMENDKEIEKDAQVAYLEDILKDKDETHYRKKLARLWYIIAGEKVDFPKANGALECKNGRIAKCEPVGLTDDEKKNLLADRESILDLIEKSEKKEILNSKEWKNLLELAGLKEKNNKYEPEEFKNSFVLQFMCLMDSKIKKKNIGKDDVEEILNYFSKLNENEGWKVKGANPKVIKSFHDWFCALDDCLDKIRKGLKDEQGK